MLKIVVEKWEIHPHFGGERRKQWVYAMADAETAEKNFENIVPGGYEHKAIHIIEHQEPSS